MAPPAAAYDEIHFNHLDSDNENDDDEDNISSSTSEGTDSTFDSTRDAILNATPTESNVKVS